MHQNAGAEVMMLESEGITEDLPVEEWRADIIEELNKKFGFNSFMFEASDPPVFKWYLKQFGPNVNLFIDHSKQLNLPHGEHSYGKTVTFGRIRLSPIK